jgi:protein-S-isoprenylcysteine O-methyltransferase Ste14
MVSWGKTAQKMRVPLGTVLGLFFLIFMFAPLPPGIAAHPSFRSLFIGGTIALAGGALRIWAAGHIDKGRVLAQGGPYAFTRNPLYLGSSLMAVGVLVAGQGYWLLFPVGLFFLAIYYPVMRTEEGELLQGYGDEFVRYSRRVPLFLPSIRINSDFPSMFLWSRVLRNREHRTFAGLLLTEMILIMKGIIQ